MKLLFAIKGLNSSGGGAERVFCLLCSELVARGHTLSVLSFDQPGGNSFYPLPAQLERVDLGYCANSARLSLKNLVRAIPVIRKEIVARSPDVAVGFMHSMFVPLALSLVGTSIPILASEHTVPQYYASRPVEYALMLGVAPLLAKLTVLSESIRLTYPALLRKKMIAVSNPVIVPADKVKLDVQKPRYTLLNVGRFDEGKDQSTLIRAFAQVAAKYPAWDLKLVGDGNLRSQLEKLVFDYGLSDRIIFSGFCADVNAEYQVADIFAISSKYEAFGLVTAEAMAWGLPTIGFADCPGTNELIENEVTGLLVQPDELRHIAMAQGLDRLMTDLSLRIRLGEAAREKVMHNYSLSYIADQWERILNDVKKGFGK